jgi:integrase
MKSFNNVLAELSVDHSPTTIKELTTLYRRFEKWLDGKEPTPQNAEEFVADISKSGVKQSYVLTLRMRLRTYFRQCGVNIPKTSLQAFDGNTVREDKYVTWPEVEHFYNVTDRLRDKCLILMMYSTGARANELLALNVGDVMFDEGKVKVRGLKGSRKVRVVRLLQPATVLPTLRAYLKQRNIDYSRLDNGEKKLPLFVDDRTKSKRLAYDGLVSIIYRLREVSGHEDLTAHWFRHGYTVACKRLGIPPEITAMCLGDTVGTVVRVYSHYDHTDVDQWFDKAEGKVAKLLPEEKNPIDEIGELKEHNKVLENRLREIEAQNSVILKALQKLDVV